MMEVTAITKYFLEAPHLSGDLEGDFGDLLPRGDFLPTDHGDHVVSSMPTGSWFQWACKQVPAGCTLMAWDEYDDATVRRIGGASYWPRRLFNQHLRTGTDPSDAYAITYAYVPVLRHRPSHPSLDGLGVSQVKEFWAEEKRSLDRAVTVKVGENWRRAQAAGVCVVLPLRCARDDDRPPSMVVVSVAGGVQVGGRRAD